ncbi:glycoside hydrolase family 32 protein, partial [Mycetocola reblochoni]|uniref:glycoside hydrolase family 32 protein n=1 Tax=Mycetocola reblochoni TaxID=331618 RepID=UPI000B34BA53
PPNLPRRTRRIPTLAGRGTLTALAGTAVLALAVTGCTSDGGAGRAEDDLAASEALRPGFHYSPSEGNMADPNGLLWSGEEFHLFHQQDGTWAHAVAPDLVHWEEQPTALEHDELGQALSGSAVMDPDNTSGLFPDTGRGMVAVYTNTEGGEAQSIAYSSDEGRSWERYDGNPVVANDGRTDFRDPKVFWHEQTAAWVMVVSAGSAVEILTSDDLIDWELRSEFGRDEGLHAAVWECPELFPLAVDGDPDDTRWVLAVSVGDNEETGGSTAQYFVGDFDGETFHNGSAPDEVRITDMGQDFYAAQSFSGDPEDRRVWLAWVGNWRHPYGTPTEGWANHMSVPRELSLESDGDDVVLVQRPVAELDGLRGEAVTVEDIAIDGSVPLDVAGRSLEFEAEIELGDADAAGLSVFEGDAGGREQRFRIGADAAAGEFVLDRSHAGMDAVRGADGEADPDPAPETRRSAAWEPVEDGVLRVRGYIDQSSVEVFVDDGRLSGTMLAYPDAGNDGISLYSEGGTARLVSLTVYPMDAIR